MNTLKFSSIAFAIVSLVACGGGGGGGGTAPPADTTAPTLNLPADIDAQESAPGAGAVVTYTVTATDAVDPSPTVSCTPASGTTFTLGTTVVNCTATDASSNQSSGSFNINVVPPCNTPTGGNITLDGQVTFDKVPHDPATNGLDYASTTQADARGVTVKAFNADTSAELASTQTDGAGNFSMLVPDNTFIKIRVVAEMVKTGAAPTWQVQVRDNTSSNAQYVMDGSAACTTTSNQTRNLNAPSGWGGSSYTSARSAAPFAILDAVYDAQQLVLTADASAIFPSLNLYWSSLNNDTSGDPALGQIGTSHYDGTAIYLLGDENNDTDEYDSHVVAHEWGHYLEDKFSRTDNIGGPHFLDDRLDMRVAFGEGFGNAYAAMVLNDPLYIDSNSTAQGSGFAFNVETEIATYPGWYSETSVEKILYDLYDTNNDGADSDTLTMGFAPIWDILINEQKTQHVFTSIFKFIKALKDKNPGNAVAINSIVNGQNIHVFDEYGSSETNDAGNSNVLPVFFNLTAGVDTTGVCVTRAFNRGFGVLDYNVLGMNQYLRFTPVSTGNYQFTISGGAGADPDAIFYNDSGPNPHESDGITETFTEINLTAGREYMFEVYDFNLLNDIGVNQCYTVRVDGI